MMSNLLAMTSNLLAIGIQPTGDGLQMTSSLLAMASNLLAMASNLMEWNDGCTIRYLIPHLHKTFQPFLHTFFVRLFWVKTCSSVVMRVVDTFSS